MSRCVASVAPLPAGSAVVCEEQRMSSALVRNAQRTRFAFTEGSIKFEQKTAAAALKNVKKLARSVAPFTPAAPLI